MYEDIEREEPLPSPGARIPSVRVNNDTTMCATSWCADSTLIDHANEIRSHANMDTALVRLTCNSIDYRRLNCWSSQVLNVWIIAMTNIICYLVIWIFGETAGEGNSERSELWTVSWVFRDFVRVDTRGWVHEWSRSWLPCKATPRICARADMSHCRVATPGRGI